MWDLPSCIFWKNVHCSCIKRKYPDSTLQFTDTDSIICQIQKYDVYEDFYADKHLFSFSGYEKESRFYDDENKKSNP